MRQMTVNTIFNVFGAAVFEIASAFFAKRIERTIAEETIKLIVIPHFVAREIFTFAIAEKSVTVLHNYTCDLSVIS